MCQTHTTPLHPARPSPPETACTFLCLLSQATSPIGLTAATCPPAWDGPCRGTWIKSESGVQGVPLPAHKISASYGENGPNKHACSPCYCLSATMCECVLTPNVTWRRLLWNRRLLCEVCTYYDRCPCIFQDRTGKYGDGIARSYPRLGGLCPVGEMCPISCFWKAHEPRMASTFLHGWKIQEKNNISWHVKILWNYVKII